MKKYLVIGNPIDHSLSPKLHNYWIKKNNIDAIYEKKKIYSEEIKRTSRAYQSYWFPPYEGGILLFPAHLHHGVKPNTSNEDRISVSFNIRIYDK